MQNRNSNNNGLFIQYDESPVQVMLEENHPPAKRADVRSSSLSTTTVGASAGGLSRTKSVFSVYSEMSTMSSTSSICSETDEDSSSLMIPVGSHSTEFSKSVCKHTQGDPGVPHFNDSGMRKIMEPHLRRARLQRERTRNRIMPHLRRVDASIASSVGVPYTALRKERPFLYDTDTFALDQVLARTLRVDDLSTLHELPNTDSILNPLLDAKQRHEFHATYDNFVNSFCIPLLNELSMSNRLFHAISSSEDCITYRYQAFPNITVHRPANTTTTTTNCTTATPKPPSCDVSDGHSIGSLRFHVPLTPSFGTAALYTESFPGREDWHPLSVTRTGLGYILDGARCLHFDLLNTTSSTRVSLDFTILMYDSRADAWQETSWTPLGLVEDEFSRAGPGYYRETTGMDSWTTMATTMKEHSHSNCLEERHRMRPFWAPDARCGPPFVQL